MTRRRIVTIALAAATVLILLGGAYSARAVRRDHARDEDRADVVTVATRGVRGLTTLDPKTGGTSLKRLESSLTGGFRQQFAAMYSTFSGVVEKGKVTSTGTIDATAVQSLTSTKAQVLVAAEAQVSDPKHKATARQYRFRVSLRRVGDSWRISGMEFVS